MRDCSTSEGCPVMVAMQAEGLVDEDFSPRDCANLAGPVVISLGNGERQTVRAGISPAQCTLAALYRMQTGKEIQHA